MFARKDSQQNYCLTNLQVKQYLDSPTLTRHLTLAIGPFLLFYLMIDRPRGSHLDMCFDFCQLAYLLESALQAW